jgi:hypothetical protein
MGQLNDGGQMPAQNGNFNMTWTLFLDDVRFPSDVSYDYGSYTNIVICRSMDDAVWAVKRYGLPTFISFDHDLADQHYIIGDGEKTGYTFAKWFCDWVEKVRMYLGTSHNSLMQTKNNNRST